MTDPHWEHFEHKADIGVRGFGKDAAEAFEQAALGMSALITELSLIDPLEGVDIVCEEADLELLLVDWLNALVYEISTRMMIFSRFEVRIKDGRLQARAWGEAIDRQRHQPAVEIKGATYTELAVYETEDQWMAQCVVDV